MATDLSLAMKRNPHLKDYITRFKKVHRVDPMFLEQVSRDLGDSSDQNLIYPVGDPIFIHVFGTKQTGLRYYAIEPELDDAKEEIKARLLEVLFEKAGFEGEYGSSEEFETLMDRLIQDSVEIVDPGSAGKKRGIMKGMTRGRITMSRDQHRDIKYHIKRDILESGVLEPLVRDPYIEDIHGIGKVNINIIHKIFKTMETNINFRDDGHLDEYIIQMSERSGKPASVGRPIVDAALPDGSRLNIIYADDVSRKGPSFTIRKFPTEPLSITQLSKWGTLSAEVVAYLWLCLENGMNIFVCGETASGKTTTLNGMLVLIKHEWKIYSVEDTAEVQPPHRIWQQCLTRESGPEESRVGMFDLLKAALRSRPNYIIVGEIRGIEGAIAFQAMQTGHPVIATFHAGSIVSMIQRFTGDPINVPLRFMDNLNVALIQMAVYVRGKLLRRVLSVGEIIAFSKELNGVLTKDVFKWDSVNDQHVFRGRNNSYILEQKIAEMIGLEDPREIYKELDLRTKIVQAMVDRNITAYKEVLEVVHGFQLYGVESLPFPI